MQYEWAPVSLTTIRWLKSQWILLSEGESEIKEYAALSFGQSVASQMPASVLKDYLDVSLHHEMHARAV